MSYRPRVVDRELEDRLGVVGAVVLEGPKACGKTSTARQVAASEIRLDVEPQAATAAEIAPQVVLDGATPRLIDEWQVAPTVWNHVRRSVDDRREPGQFILTGSAVPNDDVVRHTGAGRFSFLRMRPMTLSESGHSTDLVSLAGLLGGEEYVVADPGLSIEDIAERVLVGGWPGNVDRSLSAAQAARFSQDYLRQVAEVDVARLGGERRDPRAVGRLLHALGRCVATEASTRTLARDTSLSHHTVDAYLSVLERLMVVEAQPAWSASLKSRARLRRAARHHLADPSLAAAALGLSDVGDLVRQPDLFGQLFESMAVRDLRVFAQVLDGRVFHYRDSNDLEVDVVIELPGSWAAVEVKLNPSRIESGAGALLKLAGLVDESIRGKPAFLAVITATGPAYRRPDGVQVLPIGALTA